MTSTSPRVWLIAFVTLVFAIGLSAGVLVDRTVFSRRATPPPGGGRGGPIGLYGPIGPPPERYVADLARQLDLDAAQRERILAILDERRPRIQQLQQTAREQFVTEQQALFSAIAAELTPAQQGLFETLTERQRGGGRGGRDGGRSRGGGAGPRGDGPRGDGPRSGSVGGGSE